MFLLSYNPPPHQATTAEQKGCCTQLHKANISIHTALAAFTPTPLREWGAEGEYVQQVHVRYNTGLNTFYFSGPLQPLSKP